MAIAAPPASTASAFVSGAIATERGTLSEGHGRALLMAEDHAERRRLARAAAEGGWSVREVETRARAANGQQAPAERRPRRKRGVHPDQQATADRIADMLQPVFGREVDVIPQTRNGFRVQLEVDSVEDALELARRLRVRAAA